MFIKQLHRYLVGDPELLSDAERAGAAVFFQHCDPGNALESSRSMRKQTALYRAVYGKDCKSGYQYMPDETAMMELIRIFDQHHGYVPNLDMPEVLAAYQSYFFLCEAMEYLSGNRRYSPSSLGQTAYLLLVLFGESMEDSLSALDEQCIACHMSDPCSLFAELNAIRLRRNEGASARINLPAWRTIIRSVDLQASLPLFDIAIEIETKLERAPLDYHEALETAKRLEFVHASQYPEFAALCVANFIPESLYECYRNSPPEARLPICKTLLNRLPPADRLVFVRMMSIDEKNIDELAGLLRCLQGKEQSILIARIATQLPLLIQSRSDFFQLLSASTDPEARRQLLFRIPPKNIQFWLDAFDLPAVLRHLDEGICTEVLKTVLGPGTLTRLLNTPSGLVRFLREVLPRVSDHVSWLMDVMDAQTVVYLTRNGLDLCEQLRCIKSEQRLDYINSMFGPKNIQAMLGGHVWVLHAILLELRPDDRYPFLFDIIGVENLQQLIPLLEDGRPERLIVSVLPVVQKKSFSEAIRSREENHGRQQIALVRRKIMTTDFNTGFGGVTIQLSRHTGETKTVPKTVARQWACITDARARNISYEDAWSRVWTLGREAQTHGSCSMLFFPRPEALMFYEGFADDVTSTVSFSSR